MSCSLSISRAAFACSLVLAGCAGSLDDPSRFAYVGQPYDAGVIEQVDSDAGCDPVHQIFPISCSTSACHSAQTQQGNLDLESPGLPQRLVGKQAHGGPGLLIDSQNPAQSVLYLKTTDNPPFQFQMPIGADPLSSDEQACLLSWMSAP